MNAVTELLEQLLLAAVREALEVYEARVDECEAAGVPCDFFKLRVEQLRNVYVLYGMGIAEWIDFLNGEELPWPT